MKANIFELTFLLATIPILAENAQKLLFIACCVITEMFYVVQFSNLLY